MPRSKAPVKVFLAEDSQAMRTRIAALLGGSAFAVIGQAETPHGCIAGILEVQPDVVVLDVHLDGGSGLEVLRAVRRIAPAIAFLVFSNSSGPAYRKRYLDEGAVAFLDKTTEVTELVPAVGRAARTAHSQL
jgi:DNA-binding NarL/FixJ family response regulator